MSAGDDGISVGEATAATVCCLSPVTLGVVTGGGGMLLLLAFFFGGGRTGSPELDAAVCCGRTLGNTLLTGCVIPGGLGASYSERTMVYNSNSNTTALG